MHANRLQTRVWQGLERTITALGSASAVLIVLLMILTTADVLLRYSLNRPIKGAYEISEVFFLAAVFLGLAYTQQSRGHVRVELLINRLPPAAALALETTMLLLALFIYGLLGWQGLNAFLHSVVSGEFRFGLIRIPMWPARLMIPLGAFILCLRFVGEIVLNIRRLLDRDGT